MVIRVDRKELTWESEAGEESRDIAWIISYC